MIIFFSVFKYTYVLCNMLHVLGYIYYLSINQKQKGMKFRNHITLKSTLIFLCVLIGFISALFPAVEIYLRPLKNMGEILVLIAPNTLAIIIVSFYTYVITKRL